MTPTTVSVKVSVRGGQPPVKVTPPKPTLSMGNPRGTWTSLEGHVKINAGEVVGAAVVVDVVVVDGVVDGGNVRVGPGSLRFVLE
jgi:hypothetical protein